MKNMILIVGLGNPGTKYENTRHNVGFMSLDEFQKENNFPDFKINKKSNSLISEDKFSGEKIVLVKPQTFMNISGVAVKKLTANPSTTLRTGYQLPTTNLILVHDDIDLPLGKIKISKNKSSAGHKGVESIINELKTKDFIRIRIGIQPEKGKSKKVESFVVQSFSQKEKKDLKHVLKKSLIILAMLVEKGAEKTMNEFN